MHVMYLTPEFGGSAGGIGTSLLTLARAMNQRGARVSVVTRSTTDTPLHEAFRVTAIPCPPGHFSRWAFRLIAGRHALSDRPDVIHSPEWNAAAIFACRGSIPLVTRLDTPSFLVREISGQARASPAQALVERAELLQARRSRMIVAASEELAAIAARRWELPSGSVRILRNPVSLEGATERNWRATTGLVFAGRLESRKGTAILLPVIESVLASTLSRVTVVGSLAALEPGLRARLAHLQTRYGSALDVRGELPHDETLQVIAAADVVIVPSVWENAPLVVMEAMALGRPVVAAAVGGIPELVSDANGLLIGSREPYAWIDAIRELMADRARSLEIGLAAVRKSSEWDPATIAAEADALYSEAIDG